MHDVVKGLFVVGVFFLFFVFFKREKNYQCRLPPLNFACQQSHRFEVNKTDTS